LIELYNTGDIGDDDITDLNAAVSLLTDIAGAIKNEEFARFVCGFNNAVAALTDDAQQ
jgi:hypothetical protein